MSVSVLAPARNERAVYWQYVLPIATVHVLALLAFAPWLFSWSGVALAIAGNYVFGTLGINLCYHRLLTHRSLRVPKWLERSFATLAICCLQDTPVRWVATHRLHHNHADDVDHDPHTPHDDFLWGYVGWLFRKNPALHTLSFLEKYARDLLADPYYRSYERNPWKQVWVYLLHAALFVVAGLAVGAWTGGTWEAALQLAASWLVWSVFVRTVAVWHITWSVNSLAHLFGYRSHATDEQSRNNWLVAILAAGEGWHNNHHWDPASASVQFRWWEFDLTYYVIRALGLLGLATDIVPPRFIRHKHRHTAAPSCEAATAK